MVRVDPKLIHDLSNLLTAIRGYAQLLRTALPADHEAAEDVAQIDEASSRAVTLMIDMVRESSARLRQS